MPLQTPSGGTNSTVVAKGLVELTSGQPLIASAVNGTFEDLQTPSMYGLLSGLLQGGICTALGLNVTLPSGSVYYARQIWMCTTDVVAIVPNNANSYLWGCSDGKLRLTTASSIYPTGFDQTTCCLLTYAIAISGAVTLVNSVAWWARTYSGRVVQDGSLKIDYANNIIDLSLANYVVIPFVTSDPSSLVAGAMWFRSDTSEFSLYNGTTTVRVAMS